MKSIFAVGFVFLIGTFFAGNADCKRHVSIDQQSHSSQFLDNHQNKLFADLALAIGITEEDSTEEDRIDQDIESDDPFGPDFQARVEHALGKPLSRHFWLEISPSQARAPPHPIA